MLRHYFVNKGLSRQFSSVQSLSCVRLFATPWIAARQASLSITNSQSSLRLMSIEAGYTLKDNVSRDSSSQDEYEPKQRKNMRSDNYVGR